MEGTTEEGQAEQMGGSRGRSMAFRGNCKCLRRQKGERSGHGEQAGRPRDQGIQEIKQNLRVYSRWQLAGFIRGRSQKARKLFHAGEDVH